MLIKKTQGFKHTIKVEEHMPTFKVQMRLALWIVSIFQREKEYEDSF